MYAVNRDTGRIGKVIAQSRYSAVLIVQPLPCNNDETACERWENTDRIDTAETLDALQEIIDEAHE